MKTITLPSGATAEIVEPDELSFGDREDLLALIEGDPEDLGAHAGRATNATVAAAIAYIVQSWTCTDPKTGEPLPLPRTDLAIIRRLPLKDGAYLDHVIRQRGGMLSELFPDFDVAPEGSPTQP